MEEEAKRILYPHEHRHPIYRNMLFQWGQGPYAVTDPNPSLGTCFREMNATEWTFAALTALLPAYVGYRETCKLSL